MNGKIVGGFIVGAAAVASLAIYYLQEYGYYHEVELRQGDVAVELTLLASGAPEEIISNDFKAIDAESSPIRYRACFTTPMSQAMLSETYKPYEGAEPLTGPSWFDCYDAAQVGAALENGEAMAFTGVENIYYGIDRVVAVLDDGRGFVWHQINRCGEEVFDGNPPPLGCPDPEGFVAARSQEGESDG